MIQIAGNYQFFHSNIHRAKLLRTVQALFEDYKRSLQNLSLVLLNDEEIRELNKSSLNHDYYTDILTFDLSENTFHVETELYISVDRIRENAKTFKTSNHNELLRVILHGCLHIAGHKDKTETETKQMRAAENKYIKQYQSLKNG